MFINIQYLINNKVILLIHRQSNNLTPIILKSKWSPPNALKKFLKIVVTNVANIYIILLVVNVEIILTFSPYKKGSSFSYCLFLFFYNYGYQKV